MVPRGYSLGVGALIAMAVEGVLEILSFLLPCYCLLEDVFIAVLAGRGSRYSIDRRG